MTTILMTTSFKRKKDCLYYVGTSPEGFLTVCETVAARAGRPKKDKEEKKE